mmetsp:Transcript_13738/g.19051  ORF Transcript_13738/g.19051 Transcript_13738/m.19051 type:complete len:374 (-) Transcript_13738:23-1144(-)
MNTKSWFILGFMLRQVTAACEDVCSDNGYCDGRECKCFNGYFGSDCTETLNDHYKSSVIALQAILGTLFVSLLLLSLAGLFDSLRRNSSGLVLVTNVRSIIFGLMLIVAVTESLYVIMDPWSLYFMPRIVNNLLFGTQYSVVITCFAAILFHWIEVVRTSIQTIRKENMMQNINVHYKGKEVTVEDMVERVKFLQKLKIPFALFLILLTAAIYVMEIFMALEPQLTTSLLAILNIMVGLCWLFMLLGFLIYGRRLIRLVPFQITKKVKKLTHKLTVLSAFILLLYIVVSPPLIVIPASSGASILGRYAAVQLLVWFVCFAICVVFMRWQKRFPFLVFGETSRSGTGTSGKNTHSQSNHANGVSVEVVNDTEMK